MNEKHVERRKWMHRPLSAYSIIRMALCSLSVDMALHIVLFVEYIAAHPAVFDEMKTYCSLIKSTSFELYSCWSSKSLLCKPSSTLKHDIIIFRNVIFVKTLRFNGNTHISRSSRIFLELKIKPSINRYNISNFIKKFEFETEGNTRGNT